MNLLEAMEDPQLFGLWFRGESWNAWKVFLKALLALPLDSDDLDLYRRCTGRSTPPSAPASEGWVIAGRRAGKSHIAALLVTYIATFMNFSRLAPGEKATCMAIASDRKQARVIFRYIQGMLESVPLLNAMVEGMTKESISLTNAAVIEVHTASYRAIRGYSIAAVVLDELAFWDSALEAANPDQEVIAALKPGMASIPGSLLLCISSPYSRRGALWAAYRRYYGQDSDAVLVWKADTETMNPGIDRALIARAYEQDPQRASAEYGGQFRTDVEAFISRETIDACVIPGRFELPYVPNTVYRAFCDPSGGSSDSFAVAVAHQEGDVVVLDALREKPPPFSPDRVCREYAALLKSYGLSEISGDKYGGGWPAERFQAYNICYRPSERTKSEIYLECLPLLNAGRIELLDNQRLISQLASLERRTARSGKDSVDPPPRSHDDACNAVCGALLLARRGIEITSDMFEFAEGTDWSVASLTDDSDREFIYHGF